MSCSAWRTFGWTTHYLQNEKSTVKICTSKLVIQFFFQFHTFINFKRNKMHNSKRWIITKLLFACSWIERQIRLKLEKITWIFDIIKLIESQILANFTHFTIYVWFGWIWPFTFLEEGFGGSQVLFRFAPSSRSGFSGCPRSSLTLPLTILKVHFQNWWQLRTPLKFHQSPFPKQKGPNNTIWLDVSDASECCKNKFPWFLPSHSSCFS